METQKNFDTRFLIESNCLRYAAVARKVGVTPTTLWKWLQEDLTPMHKARIEKAVNEMIKERKA